MRNLEKDLKTCYINGGLFTAEEVIKIYNYGNTLDIDGYKQLFNLRYVNNLSCKEVKKLMGLTDYHFEKTRRYLLITLVRCSLDGFKPRLKPFTSVSDLKKIFISITKEDEYKAIQWLKTSELCKSEQVKDLCAKISYLWELIEKFKSLGWISSITDLIFEKADLKEKLYKAIGITIEDLQKIE